MHVKTHFKTHFHASFIIFIMFPSFSPFTFLFGKSECAA